MAASVKSYVYITAGEAWEFWVDVDAGSGPIRAELTTGALFIDLLDALALALADASGVDATATYSDVSDRVTMTLDGADFVEMSPYAARVLGFADTAMTGQSSTGDVGPGCIVTLRAAVIDPLRVVDRAELLTYRHGQAMATTWAAMRVRNVDLIARDTADRLGAWVTCGYVQVADDAGDVVTGWVVDESDLSTQGAREEILIRRLVLIDDPYLPTATRYTGIWGALAFGWQVVYGLQLDGIPTAFVERTGGVLTGDGSLSIDDSAEVGVEVDREKGLGAGLALTAVLRDTEAVRGLLRRPSHVARLAADYAPGDTTMVVDDVTGWPTSGRLYIGGETFAYSGVSGGDTFTGLTGGNGVLAREYAAATGWTVTDRPTGWRGRRCALYAYPVDPSGRVVDDATRVFMGEVETEPLRRRDGWTLQIQPLDRVLEREIVGAVSGVVESQDGVVCYPQLELVFYVAGRKNDGTSTFAYTFSLKPFDDLTQPTVLGWPDVMARVRNEWTAVVGAIVGNVYIDDVPALEPNGNYGFNLRIPLLYDNNFHVWRYSLTVNNATSYGVSGLSPWQNMPHNYGASDSLTTQVVVGWADGDIRNVIVVETKGAFFAEPWYMLPCAFIRAEQPFTETADQLRLTVGGKVIDCTCDSVIADDGRLFAYNIRAKNGGYTVPGNLLGAAVRVGKTVVGTYGSDLPNIAYTILTSVGPSNNANSIMDILSASQGYAIPSSLLTYAGTSLGEGDPGTLDTLACAAIATLSAMPDRISLIDMLGGLLALRRQAIAVVPFGDDLKMMLVSTAPGTPDTVAQLTDDDLLGYADDPAETVERLQPPNRVLLQPDGDGEPVIVQDLSAVAIEGPREWELTIPTQDRDSLVQLGLVYGQSLLYMDRQAQAIKVRIPPWIRATVGDSVALDTDFPGVFDPSTGGAGYTGNGRVVGAVRNLRNGAQTLTLLLDGHVASTAICGAFKVIEWTGADNAPATIDCYMPVDDGTSFAPSVYIQTADYIQRMIDAGGGSCVLLHYQPGVSEVTGETVTVTAVATIDEINDPPAVVLTVSASSGVTLTADSWLTLPDLASGDGSAWQDAQAHVDDGSYWEG